MRFGIESIDPAQHVVVLARVMQMPNDPGGFPKGERLLVENVREALGEPGSWYLDRAGRVDLCTDAGRAA